jgi:hypothetical protein
MKQFRDVFQAGDNVGDRGRMQVRRVGGIRVSQSRQPQ